MKELEEKLGQWLDFEFALVGYRDFGEKYDTQEFIKDLTQVETIIVQWSKETSGGGDQCEDVAGGLKLVAALNWKPNSLKVTVLIADAPGHGKQYYENCGDNYKDQPINLLEDIVK